MLNGNYWVWETFLPQIQCIASPSILNGSSLSLKTILPQTEFFFPNKYCNSWVLLSKVSVVIEKIFMYKIWVFYLPQIFFCGGSIFFPKLRKVPIFSPPSRGGKMARIYTPASLLIIRIYQVYNNVQKSYLTLVFHILLRTTIEFHSIILHTHSVCHSFGQV